MLPKRWQDVLTTVTGRNCHAFEEEHGRSCQDGDVHEAEGRLSGEKDEITTPEHRRAH